MLEMLRNVLYIMQRSPSFRRELEAKYRSRAIDNHLRSVPLFAPLRDDEARFRRIVDDLRPRIIAAALRAGRGDLPPGGAGGRRALPGPHRVREGLAGAARWRARPELRGAGRLHRRDRRALRPARAARLAPAGVRTATCTALDHVDLVRITPGDFRAILDQFAGRPRRGDRRGPPAHRGQPQRPARCPRDAARRRSWTRD